MENRDDDISQPDASANAGRGSRFQSNVVGPAWLRFSLGSDMSAPVPSRPLVVPRFILLVVGCLPMILTHGALTVFLVYPLFAVAAGDFRQIALVVWWLLGSVGLLALVYTCVTLAPRNPRLSKWQRVTLTGGIIAAAPLILGYCGDWWVGASAVLSSGTSAYLLTNCQSESLQSDGDEAAPNKTRQATAASRLDSDRPR